ncbi:hypothetical protein vBAmePPT11V19_00001 [Alteromonas phage vB_AmeP_PT11-V19]|nr:hypothetical protein vBAmePPT11V19_00001 [Alteromonas phage vB_AmeP_PT11-V19]
MSKELSVDLVQSQLAPQQRLLIDEGTVEEIKKLGEDPAYGDEFLELYLMHLNVLKNHVRADHKKYVNAVKYFVLLESGNNITDAYIKVFPERYEQRNRNLPPEERGKDIMRSEASRFNASVLVTEIRRYAAVPVNLIHRNLLHEAILEQANLMRNAKSEVVRQKAGETLIKELKPTEEQEVKISVSNEKMESAIDALYKATQDLAESESRAIKSGTPLKEIAERNIIEAEVEEISGDD